MSQSRKRTLEKAAAVVGDVISSLADYALSNKDKPSDTNQQTNNEQQQESEEILIQQKPKLKEVDFKVHVAIDFGTDGCAIAFAFKDEVIIYNRWKTKRHSRTVKTKTQILLNQENEIISFGDNAKKMYTNLTGTERNSWKLFERFKMSLYDNDLENKINKMDIMEELTAVNGSKCPSEIVFVATFQHLHNDAIKYLKKMTNDDVADEEIQWIVTVPSIWSQKACDKMKEWIIKSGLVYKYIKNQCKIVCEADCAALAIKKQLLKFRDIDDEKKENNNDNTDFIKGEKYILIDAGSGTVDITGHEILSDFGIKELIAPSGGKWGASYIDEQYIELLEGIFSEEWIDEFKGKRTDVWVEVMEYFQAAKITFYEDDEETQHECRLPVEFCQFLEEKCLMENCDIEDKINQTFKNINFVEECLEIDIIIWTQLFDLTMNNIISHIQQLLETDELNGCKYICIVGGFASSTYFQFRMRKEFGEQSGYKMKLIIPDNPILCVVEGAAYFGIIKDYIKILHSENKVNLEARFDEMEGKQDGFEDSLFILEDYVCCNDNDKNILSELDSSIDDIQEKLKSYQRKIEMLQNEIVLIEEKRNKECLKWIKINNMQLKNLCTSYYENLKLWITVRIEITVKYRDCFQSKYDELYKMRDKMQSDAMKYNVDEHDLRLLIDEAIMSATNIKLSANITKQRQYEESLSLIVDEWKQKYLEQRYEDIIRPMSSNERTSHIVIMLVEILDTSNKTTMTKNVSDGLPYFHPIDNGYQLSFERLLYDPRFEQNKIIQEFINKYILDEKELNEALIDQENLSLVKISTFIYKLTNSFLASCNLSKDSDFYQNLFWDCTNLMIWRSIFPKLHNVTTYIIDKDIKSVNLDHKYGKQLVWMTKLTQNQVGIDDDFQYYYAKRVKSKRGKFLLKNPIEFEEEEEEEENKKEEKQNIFIDEYFENEEKIAYYKPINRFKQLPNIKTPQDSIVWVIDTVHFIQKYAMKYNKLKLMKNKKDKEPTLISADSLFPIMVYCLIKSNCNYWNRWIFMMRQFYTESILSFGQTGFCFSLINAAVEYILEQTPTDFGIKNDNLKRKSYQFSDITKGIINSILYINDKQ